MSYQLIEEELQKLWHDERFADFCGHPYLFPKVNPSKDLMFIGINPSFNIDDVGMVRYSIDEKGNEHQFFKKYEEIATDCNLTWTHVDLFYFRKTEQNEIYEILRSTNGADFLMEQLSITDKIIRTAKPKIIVVANALARKFMGKEQNAAGTKDVWLGYKFIFSEEMGTYFWNDTPVFFNGMLSGRAPTDKGSVERLKWHIRKAYSHGSAGKKRY